ncbi:MAG: DoxX family protein [Bacteroidetes bacterium]|nr:DoxX family protein [Bacteroidota bacterium]
MKSVKITYWTCTTLVVLFEGLLPALTFNTALAKEGISHLGYPDYFRVALTAFKVIGAILLILPQIPTRAKEWAYAGFTFTFLFAFISHTAVDGIGNGQSIFPLAVLAILLVSYVCYNRMKSFTQQTSVPVGPKLAIPRL